MKLITFELDKNKIYCITKTNATSTTNQQNQLIGKYKSIFENYQFHQGFFVIIKHLVGKDFLSNYSIRSLFLMLLGERIGFEKLNLAISFSQIFLIRTFGEKDIFTLCADNA